MTAAGSTTSTLSSSCAINHDAMRRQRQRDISTFSVLLTLSLLFWYFAIGPRTTLLGGHSKSSASSTDAVDNFDDAVPILPEMAPAPAPSAENDTVSRKSRSKHAIVTLLMTDGYTIGVETMAHSLRKVMNRSVKYDLVAAYVPGVVSKKTLCIVRAHGWITKPIERVEPVIVGRKGPLQKRWFWVYTKLRLWSFTEYESLIFMDADMLALRDFSHIFSLPVDFAAVPDLSWPYDFNTGLMLIRPNMNVYNDLLKTKANPERLKFDPSGADQAFIAAYFRHDMYLLPYKHNVNIAMARDKELWDLVWPHATVIHFTDEKPFFEREPKDKRFVEAFAAWHKVEDDLGPMRIDSGVFGCAVEDATSVDPYEYPDIVTPEELHRRRLGMMAAGAMSLTAVLYGCHVRRRRPIKLSSHSV